MKECEKYYTLIKYCKAVSEGLESKELALPSEHSIECGRASPIAPQSVPTTRGDTPIYFIIDKTSKQATITVKDGQKQLMQWNTPIDKPTLHLGWRKISQAVKNKEIVFKNEHEQIFFTNLAKKSFGYERRMQFKDILKNKYSFIE